MLVSVRVGFVLASLVIALATSCGGASRPADQPSKPADEPAVSAYEPTVEDFRIGVAGYQGTFKDTTVSTFHQELAERHFDLYAAEYAASQCLAGEDLTAEGFREYVRTTSVNEMALASARALEIIMLYDKVEEECMRRYLFPETAAQALEGVRLVIAVGENTGINSPESLQMSDNIRQVVEDRALIWFSKWDQEQSFLKSFCVQANNQIACLRGLILE